MFARVKQEASTLTAFIAAGFCLLAAFVSCTESSIEEERIPEPEDVVKAVDFSLAYSHREGDAAAMVLTLSSGETKGMYGIEASCADADGRTLSEKSGEILLVPGCSRTILLPVDGEGCEISCSLEGPGGARSVKRISLTGESLEDRCVFGYGDALPDEVEMRVGELTVLPSELLGAGDIRATGEGDVLVETDAFGVNVTPLSEGESSIVIADGPYTDRMTVKAVAGTPSATVSLPQNVVVMKDAEAVIVATAIPYGSVSSECSWSVDRSGVISLEGKGASAWLKGLSVGTANVTMSSPAGTVTTAVKVIESSPLQRVTSVAVTPEEISLKEGETASVNVTYEPADAVLGRIRWSIAGDRESISLDSFELAGEIKGLCGGSATVTVDIDGVQSSMNVTVTSTSEDTPEPDAPTYDISMPENIVLITGSESVVKARYLDGTQPSGGSWATTPEGYVSFVHTDGATAFIKALKQGTTELVYKVGSSVGTTHVKIISSGDQDPDQPGGDIKTLESVALPASLEMTEGEDRQLTATLTPSSYIPENVSWSLSSDDGAAIAFSWEGTTVSLSAATAGTATLSVTVDGKTASTRITVKKKPVELLSVDLTVSPSETIVKGGKTALTASLTPGNYSPAETEWSVTPSGIVSLSTNGLTATATGIAEGTADVTFTADGKSKTVRITVANPTASYVPSLNATEFFEGQDVVLSFAGEEKEGVSVEVRLDGTLQTFNASGMTLNEIGAGSHKFTVVQKYGDSVLDSTELPFVVYPAPAPTVKVSCGTSSETFSSYVCIHRGLSFSVNVICSGVDDFSADTAEGSASIITSSGKTLVSVKTGEGYFKWTARKGGATAEGRIPVVVYDSIIAKVSASLKGLSVSDCYITLDVTGNGYGNVSASGVSVVPHYRIPLPNGKELRHTGAKINAGTVSLANGAHSEWNAGDDASACQSRIKDEGYNISDIATIYITLEITGTISDDFLVLDGEGGAVRGCITGGNGFLKEYYKNR